MKGNQPTVFRKARRLLSAVAICCVIAGSASATNLTAVRYDEATDTLIVNIAYRASHDKHRFSVSWGECKRLDDERSQTYGLLTDSDPMDHASKEMTEVLKVNLNAFGCRPALVTIRTSAGFNRTISIPVAKKVEPPRRSS